uniref:LEM domain-containing protein n=1 Tax=Naja naja TaxID=35670 RepID=A0A8C6YFM1_NAJNA
MDEYKGMTDKELIARLKKYSIPHGPLVGSTRKLYEKKIYEYETERTQYPSPGGSHTGKKKLTQVEKSLPGDLISHGAKKDWTCLEDSSSSYQSIFQRKSSGLSSLQVQPRRAIHPERQAQAAEKALESNAETKRYLPLWLQLLVFGLLAAFLVFIYFLEGGADGNPFVKYISQ